MAEKTDEEIVLRVQKGDAESFGLLIERYEEKILRYARKFVSNTDDIQDIIQEVFIKAYINIKSFDTGKRFSPWIYRIAHNEFVNALKKKSRMPIQFFDPDVFLPHLVAEETADSEANRKELKQMLDAYLDKLSSKYRELLVLYYFEDMDYKEIAEVLRIPVSTVGVRLRRAKGMLKKMVQGDKIIHG